MPEPTESPTLQVKRVRIDGSVCDATVCSACSEECEDRSNIDSTELLWVWFLPSVLSFVFVLKFINIWKLKLVFLEKRFLELVV